MTIGVLIKHDQQEYPKGIKVSMCNAQGYKIGGTSDRVLEAGESDTFYVHKGQQLHIEEVE